MILSLVLINGTVEVRLSRLEISIVHASPTLLYTKENYAVCQGCDQEYQEWQCPTRTRMCPILRCNPLGTVLVAWGLVESLML